MNKYNNKYIVARRNVCDQNIGYYLYLLQVSGQKVVYISYKETVNSTPYHYLNITTQTK